jgi:uncharacterized protein YjiS (DUF1127 family)
MSMLDEAPVCAAAGREQLLPKFGLATLINGFSAMVRTWSNRRSVRDLRELDDAQLADIGLRRNDVHAALDLPFSVDPSHYLISARQNPLRGTRRF